MGRQVDTVVRMPSLKQVIRLGGGEGAETGRSIVGDTRSGRIEGTGLPDESE